MTAPADHPGRADDEKLMRRVQAGQTEAFEHLYERHAPRALRVARAVCPDPRLAEDAVQEGFLSMWRGRMAYRPASGSFRVWAMQIVRHRAIDSLRHEGARPPTAELKEDMAEPAPSSVSDRVIARDESAALRASLQRLPEAQAEVITLAYFGELSHSEIAERLSLPAGTVKGRMRLGLEKLRREIGAAE